MPPPSIPHPCIYPLLSYHTTPVTPPLLLRFLPLPIASSLIPPTLFFILLIPVAFYTDSTKAATFTFCLSLLWSACSYSIWLFFTARSDPLHPFKSALTFLLCSSLSALLFLIRSSLIFFLQYDLPIFFTFLQSTSIWSTHSPQIFPLLYTYSVYNLLNSDWFDHDMLWLLFLYFSLGLAHFGLDFSSLLCPSILCTFYFLLK